MFNQSKFGSLVNGKWQTNGKEEPLISPVTKKEWKTLCLTTDDQIAAALEAVKKNPLKEMTAYERAAILNKIAELLLKHKEELATCITMEMGKPMQDARGEIDFSASFFRWFAEEAKRIYGMEIPSNFPDKRIHVRHEPIGPCGIITPWNFPVAMPARKFAPAFAAGCPVISKPSPETPVSQLLVAALCIEAGIPKESLHILIGDEKKIGEALLGAPHIRKISFTGSCAVGKLLYRMSAETLKKMTMELGGHAPLIVFDDADLDKAIEGAFVAKFRLSGQTCVCANRLFVHKKILPEFLKRYTEKVKSMKIGDPLKDETDLTHSIHPESQKKARAHIEDAIQKGATAHLNAKEPFEPEILTDVTPEMLIFNEETFGPVAAIITFEDEEKVIELANKTPYGLAAYVFTEGLKRAENVTSKLEFGIIGLNDGLPSCAQAPFGGIKASGFGREGGASGIYEYLSEKLISQRL